MGIIRLTLITAALIWLAMMYFGRDDGLPENRIGRDPAQRTPVERVEGAPASVAASEPAPAPEPEPEPAPVTPAPQPDPAPAATPEVAQPTARPEPPATADALGAAVADAVQDALTAPEPAPEPQPESDPPTEAAPEPEPVLFVTGSRVNVRSGPSTIYGAITALTRGTAVGDLGDAGEGWRMIRLPGGEIGYMSGDFLSTVAP